MMPTVIRLGCCLALGSLLGACTDDAKMPDDDPTPVPTQPDDRAWATRLEVAEPKAGAVLTGPVVETMESQPVQFAVSLAKQMPMPGFEVKIDVAAPDAAGRILVRVEETPPAASAPPSRSTKVLRIPVGSLKVGDYELRVESRRSGQGAYALVQNVELTARPE